MSQEQTTVTTNSNLVVKPKKKSHKWLHRTLNFVLVLIAIVVIGVLIFNVIFFRSKVEGMSMQPTYNELLTDVDDASTSIYKDIAVANRWQKGERGDIVIIKAPNELLDSGKLEDEIIIKRIIGVGGDKITLRYDEDSYECKYLVNGEEIDESYIGEHKMNHTYFTNFMHNTGATPEESPIPQTEDATLNVPEDQIFVLGDNRDVSRDSSFFGCISHSCVMGKVSFSYKYNETIFDALWKMFVSIF